MESSSPPQVEDVDTSHKIARNQSDIESPSFLPSLDQNQDQQIAAVLVVGFHHACGPIVEFCIPPLPRQPNSSVADQTMLEKLELPEEWSFLPFLALPDGAHQKDEDLAYFHLPPVPGWSVAKSTLFGISCNRQIASKDLVVTTPDITRSIVQKAVVILAQQPIFGLLRQKLAVITAAWFNQRDFTQLAILRNLYSSLTSSFYGSIDDSMLYMGTSLREFLFKFKSKALILLKLLLLEKRNAGAPELKTSEHLLRRTEAKELRNGNKESLLSYMGLPLKLFEEGSFFQPYLPLQQIDMLASEKTKSYLVGTTNQIFFHHKSDIKIDVLVNVETGNLEFYDQKLAYAVNPTMADRRWMERITHSVLDPNRPLQNTYLGSDDYLRAGFEEYVLSLLSSMKHAQASNLLADLEIEDNLSEEVMRDDDRERNYLLDYGMDWLMKWRGTNNFRIWNHYTDHEIYEIVEPGHPGMGNISITDIQNTLSNRLRDLQIRQNLAPLRHTLSKAMSGGAKAMSSGRSRLMRGVDAIWNEFERDIHEEANSSQYRNALDSSRTKSNRSQTHPESGETGPLLPIVDSTSQQAGRLLSNFSSFLSRKHREISQSIEVNANFENVKVGIARGICCE
ncbi:late secretory pathway protein avl9 [Apophysomyces ossiformis]|uniref:Late secretory pathway protein avl9 n=1 Tax=Apophysomyces ossiformis TaxID=679940 RepID=A0A8H7BT63_9FUNG|nr:late secretory pathway protein avl9 [Apophysomyces ossiformis]